MLTAEPLFDHAWGGTKFGVWDHTLKTWRDDIGWFLNIKAAEDAIMNYQSGMRSEPINAGSLAGPEAHVRLGPTVLVQRIPQRPQRLEGLHERNEGDRMRSAKIIIFIQTSSTDRDMDELVEGIDDFTREKIAHVMGLGYNAEGEPISEQITSVTWAKSP